MKHIRKRNQSMECCKMLMAAIVVFNHARFPASVDWIISCLICFVVPMFIGISGYFNYGATPEQLKRRLLHIAKLNIAADLVHVIWTCIYTELQGGSTIAYLRAAVPDANELIWWLLTNRNSFLGHLWYLAAIGITYAFMWGYSCFYRNRKIQYQPLYFLAFSLFAAFFAMGVVMPAADIVISGFAYRNGWFLGIPMFTLGIFIHEYQDRILECFQLTSRKLVLVILGCIGFTFFQDRAVGMAGYPFVLPVTIAAGILLMNLNPTPFREDGWFARVLVSRFGLWSTYIYLFHLTICILYNDLVRTDLAIALGAWEPWLTPFIVLLASFLFAVVVEQCISRLFRRKKSPLKA